MGLSMRDQQKEVAFNLRKAEEYRQKAEAATEPRMKAAFNAVVREYLGEPHPCASPQDRKRQGPDPSPRAPV